MSDYTPSDDEIRAEYLARYSHANVRDRYDADLMMAGFEDGARWAAGRTAVLAEQAEPEWEYVYEDAEADRPTMRRRKAGPWQPVPADETEGAGDAES
ncbi:MULTISPECIES: hypothetical protein [Bacteria]|uniref:Uncharacterized protein n=1 Tax=Microbacterium phage Min1 TaxID=446529 RepID=A6N1Y8_9CAUD|nr:hypothetical protein MPMin1_gp30 [Microbacterium phage Min1]ABR10460.1 hypothetical protein [Microbacterium phage Min1]